MRAFETCIAQIAADDLDRSMHLTMGQHVTLKLLVYSPREGRVALLPVQQLCVHS
jgi:hypothetical protein